LRSYADLPEKLAFVQTEATAAASDPAHGFNGDILVRYPVARRRHELTSTSIRVSADFLKNNLYFHFCLL
jgi:asparagine synthetase A